MSKALNEFTRAYNRLNKIYVPVFKRQMELNTLLVLETQSKQCDINDDTWKNLDVKTRADMKLLILSGKINKQLLPIMYPDIDFAQGIITLERLANPRSIPVNKVHEVFAELKNLADDYIKMTKEERSAMVCVLDFIKACTNLVISLATFGAKKNFFETTTTKLNEFRSLQNTILSYYGKLPEDEQTVELTPTSGGLQIPSL